MPKKETSNVISFYTKRPIMINKINDKEIEDNRIYLGVLKNNDGLQAKKLIEHLNIKHEQINNFIEEFEKLNDSYIYFLQGCLRYLKAEELDLTRDDIYIDKDFHVWVVKKSEGD